MSTHIQSNVVQSSAQNQSSSVSVGSQVSFQVLPSSRSRKIGEIFAKFICLINAIRSSCYNWKISCPKSYGRFAQSMAFCRVVTDVVFSSCVANWEARFPQLTINQAFTFEASNTDEQLKDLESEKTLLAIPVKVKGLLRDHIVVFVYDSKTQELTYFDSKGLSIEDRGNDLIAGRPESHTTLAQFARELHDRYHPTQIKENTTKYQWDGYNCGIYVLDYIERRGEGKSHEEICAKGLSFSEANAKRAHFAEFVHGQEAY